jgi:hypothetical protein
MHHLTSLGARNAFLKFRGLWCTKFKRSEMYFSETYVIHAYELRSRGAFNSRKKTASCISGEKPCSRLGKGAVKFGAETDARPASEATVVRGTVLCRHEVVVPQAMLGETGVAASCENATWLTYILLCRYICYCLRACDAPLDKFRSQKCIFKV